MAGETMAATADVLRGSALSRAHRRIIVRRSPRFVAAWLAYVAVWEVVLLVQGRSRGTIAALAVVAQAAVALTGVRIARAAAPAHAVPIVLATVVALGWAATAAFAAVGGSGDVLAFLLLLLYLTSSLFFAWGAVRGLVVLVATAAACVAAIPRLHFAFEPLELATAIVLGSAVSIAAAEAARRAVTAALVHRIGELRARRALTAALRRERRARRDAEQSRADAEAAAHARDELVAMVSHELRSPLHAVRTWTELLRRGRVDPPRVREILSQIEENCRLQARLVEDLVDTARLASGRLALRRQRVDVRQVVERTAAQVRPTAEAKGVRLVARAGTAPAPLVADPIRLHQVVENLLSNAVRHTNAGDEIAAEVRPTESGVEIVVCDTGPGIPVELLPVVFEPYTSGNREEAARLGLGLAIARSLVELHGGRIAVESGAPARGTTFRIWLPATEPNGDRAKP